MRRDPVSEKRIAEDPVGEGARALEAVLEWYAAYKRLWRNHPQAKQLAVLARHWLRTRLESALNLEDEIDPVAPSKPKRR